MIVTQVEMVTKIKSKVFIDEQFAFVLYKGELSRYHIVVGSEIEEAVYNKIRMEVILKRGKLRAMHLLNAMDRTEAQLRTKLRQSYYPEDIMDTIIIYVKSFGYIEDSSYARRYILSKQDKKSKKEIQAGLYGKGLKKEAIEHALEECYDDAMEAKTIQELLLKKRFQAEGSSSEEERKVFGYFMRKGFSYDSVKHAIEFNR